MDALVRYSERRKDTRSVVDKHGRVHGGADSFTYVKVKDISESGAGIEAYDAHQLPDEFDLLLVEDCMLYRVSVRWRRGTRLGLQFKGKPKRVVGAL